MSVSTASFKTRFFAALKQFKNGSIKLVKDGVLKLRLKPEEGKIYTPHEVITYHEFRRDLTRILPAFVIFWIPFVGQWVAVPLVMIFPRQLLSRQFWTDEQRILAYDYALKRREEAYDSLSQTLVTTLEQSLTDKKLVNICVDCLDNLRDGKKMDFQQTQVFRDVLSDQKLSLEMLPKQHKIDLASSLNIHTPSLTKHAVYLNNVDRSVTHFGIDSLTKDLFDMVCHQRGAPLEEAAEGDLKRYLQGWFKQTVDIRVKDLGYMLHLPFLLQNEIRPRERQQESPSKDSEL